MSNPLNHDFSENVPKSYNWNFKTMFLVIILICACCLVCIGFNFNLEEMINSSIVWCACSILVVFMIYIFYEYYKDDTCSERIKSGWDRAKTAVIRGRDDFTNNARQFGNDIMNFRYQPNQYIPNSTQPNSIQYNQ